MIWMHPHSNNVRATEMLLHMHMYWNTPLLIHIQCNSPSLPAATNNAPVCLNTAESATATLLSGIWKRSHVSVKHSAVHSQNSSWFSISVVNLSFPLIITGTARQYTFCRWYGAASSCDLILDWCFLALIVLTEVRDGAVFLHAAEYFILLWCIRWIISRGPVCKMNQIPGKRKCSGHRFGLFLNHRRLFILFNTFRKTLQHD